jgi:hypothetical protein
MSRRYSILSSGSGRVARLTAGGGILFALAILTGCRARVYPTTGPAIPFWANSALNHPDVAPENMEAVASAIAVAAVDALAFPPPGWSLDPMKESDSHSHLVWISPSGRTAYGIIRIQMPLPVGNDAALWGFMMEMRRSEGEGLLLGRERDPQIDGIRFVAEGGRYLIRANLVTRGWIAWAVYAGTLRAHPVELDELLLAERARERTVLGPKDEDR